MARDNVARVNAIVSILLKMQKYEEAKTEFKNVYSNYHNAYSVVIA